MLGNPQYIEIFHLFFLRQLGERVQKGLYALKGGCNLRFYFKSIRYSEDMDFDIKTIARDTLKSNVRKILQSSSFLKPLATRGIEISAVSEPKQTDTTQRWKLLLRVKSRAIPLPTKIEFSRRSLGQTVQFEPVDSELIQAYGLYPIYTNHYAREIALHQKILALVQRTEIQARDVFDIDLLISPAENLATGKKSHKNITDDVLEKAKMNALAISFRDFKSQVLAYLMPQYQPHYDQKRWDQIVERVISFLERLKS